MLVAIGDFVLGEFVLVRIQTRDRGMHGSGGRELRWVRVAA